MFNNNGLIYMLRIKNIGTVRRIRRRQPILCMWGIKFLLNEKNKIIQPFVTSGMYLTPGVYIIERDNTFFL